MAKAINWNPFGPWSGNLAWEHLFDGQVWEISKGEDFDLAPETIARQLRTEHARQYGELLVKVDGDVVRVQRVPGIREDHRAS